MKIILLGASGQLGREWQHVISGKFADKILLLPYSSSQLNITDHEKVTHELQEQQPDSVVNCAAYTMVDAAEDHKELAQKVNADAVSHLAQLGSKLGFKLVYYSTDYVFAGQKGDHKKWPDGYSEDHPTEPINWYGQTKCNGEQAVREGTDKHLILRTSWLCGQFGVNFVTKMLELGRERDQLQVVDDQFGSPAFAENIVQNSINLLQLGQAGTYNITSSGLISWYEFARKIFELSDISIQVKPVSSQEFSAKAKRPCFSKLSTKKIELISGSEIIEWEDGLAPLLDQLENR